MAPPEIATPPTPRDTAVWHIHLDAQDRRLGAYTIAIRFNPSVAVIESIEACDVKHFKGSPECDPATFAAGMTRVSAIDAFPSKRPAQEYHLLTVTFHRSGPGTLVATAVIEKLYDDSDAGRPIPGILSIPRFEHVFK